ncbi:MAG: hypothetical protein D6703_05375 [Zetaproteobacteria bacterium]|nr:MAG: hypothetical protein D6703_05375 [Zetaproteobacteria bacterium]
MRELLRSEDMVFLRLLSEELSARGIEHRLEGEAVNALMPIGELMAPRILVEDADMQAALRVLEDLRKAVSNDHRTREG